MKNQLTIVAKIVAKTEHTECVKTELLKLVDASIHDKGCINYNLLQDNTDLNSFVVYENWDDEEALNSHLNTVHFKAFTEATDGKLDVFTVNKMTMLS
ncbi:putative quinol monooxygenase [uncultured Formosa sp.]|uniref:putative quinol monooxygenase n=1 Tax=uncultured Formosa sp. TaxID=255435 RepID=UPI002630B29A|nr:putative quinol monooxygenase [uncultured Formosa sp.]